MNGCLKLGHGRPLQFASTGFTHFSSWVARRRFRSGSSQIVESRGSSGHESGHHFRPALLGRLASVAPISNRSILTARLRAVVRSGALVGLVAQFSPD